MVKTRSNGRLEEEEVDNVEPLAKYSKTEEEVVDLLRQFQVDNIPFLMLVAIVEGQHQVMKVFSGVKDIANLYGGG